MVGKDRAMAVIERVLELSPGDQTEVSLHVTDNSLTRFSSNYIHQNVAEKDVQLSVKVILGKKIGTASTNSLDEDAIKSTVQAAASIARLQKENQEFRSLPGPQPLPEVDCFVPATAQFSPEDRADAVAMIINAAKAAGFQAAGAVSTGIREIAVGNSLGVRAYNPVTSAAANTVVMSGTSSGFAHGNTRDVATLDFAAIGRRAVDKCARSIKSEKVEPGEYEVILEPAAAANVLMYVALLGFSALAVQEGRSFLAGKLGEKVFGDNITVWDDGLDPRGMPMPFDGEGQPKRKLMLVENGVAKNVVYDSFTAKKEGKESTGHAGPGRFGFGPIPTNLFFGAGDATMEDMIRSTKKGILVTRFHYTNPVHPLRVVVTGMTRDGTFLVEDGEIKCAVKNLRFTDSMIRTLNHVDMIGKDWGFEGAMGLGGGMIPALKVSKFAFTGVTEF
ncbi:MAG: TldD/PmbA family protein [Bacillota bacterium]